MADPGFVIRLHACDPIKITRAALDGLMAVARHDGRTRIAGLTDPHAGTIHWSAADGLLAAGLARWVPNQAKTKTGDRLLELTPLGRRAHRQLDTGGAA